MTYLTRQSRLLRSTLALILLSLCFEAVAAKPPPGVPKKKACSDNLIATKVVNLEFGTFDGTTAGTVTITTSGSRSSTGPTLVGGTVNAAAFDVSNALSGCDYYPVRVQIQGVPTDLAGPGAVMPSDIYISSPTGTFTLSATPGTPTRVSVGATLTTGSAQTSGTYTTLAPFTMRFSHRNP
jgi:hypothetical protein